MAELEAEFAKDEKETKKDFKRLDFTEEGDEWSAIAKYNRKIYEEQIKLEKIKDEELKKRNKADLDLQIKQRLKQEYENELKEKEYDKLMKEHQKEMDLRVLLQFGDFLICSGTSLLAVKLGLSVISPFSAPFVEEVMMEFGIYDEFTYYAARTLSRGIWPNGNEELFSLAKKVHGWGRIHAVEWLEPKTQEIRDWLLYEGADNRVIPQYSANICLQKAEALKRLDGCLTAKEYEAIGKLILESLTEGPCRGVADGELLLPKFIGKAKEFRADPEVFEQISDAADEYGLSPEMKEAAKRLAGFIP